MAVKIRLSRIGRKHVPIFRVVAIDSRDKRDGKCLDNIGTYDALNTSIVRFEEELYDKWIKCGAQPSDSARKVHRLFKRKGIAAAKAQEALPEVKPKKAAPKKEATQKEAAQKEAPAPKPAAEVAAKPAEPATASPEPKASDA